MDQAPRGGPSSSPRREGAGPPSTLGGGGLVYGSKRNGGQPDWARGWAPHRGAWVGVEAGGVRGLGVGCWELLGEGGDAAGGTARPPGPPARRRGVSRPGRSAAQPGRGGDPRSAGDAVVKRCLRSHGVVQMMEL